MATKFPTKPVSVDQFGHQQGGGQFVQNEINQANVQVANRVITHGETGRLSDGSGRANVSVFAAVAVAEDVDVATDTIGPTKATLDAQLALTNDGISAVLADCNTLLVALGLTGVVNNGGGTPASPIAAMSGDSGTAAVTGPTAANLNPIRIQMDVAMHTAGALVNKIMRQIRMQPVDIQNNPMLEPPPDNYGQGSIGFNPPDGGVGPVVSPEEPTVSTAGSSRAFATDSPFSDPVGAITEDSGTFAGTGVTKAFCDAMLDLWRVNIETLATRLSVATFSVVALTDSSTGSAAADGVVALVQLGFGATVADGGPTGFVNEADDSTDLALGADVDASWVEVRDGIEELGVKAQEIAAGLGVGDAVYDGGGAGTNDTIAAIDQAITAAAIGPQATEFNTWAVAVDIAFDMLTVLANRCSDEVGIARLVRPVFAPGVTSSNSEDGNPVNADVPPVNPSSGVLDPFPGSTIIVSSGTPADPGIKDLVAEAALVLCADNVATLAAKLNAVRTALQSPLVKLV